MDEMIDQSNKYIDTIDQNASDSRIHRFREAEKKYQRRIKEVFKLRYDTGLMSNTLIDPYTHKMACFS